MASVYQPDADPARVTVIDLEQLAAVAPAARVDPEISVILVSV